MAIAAQIMWILIYLIVGSIISVPYTYLAGGAAENYILTVFFAPAVTMALCLIYAMRRYEHPWWGDRGFLVFAAYAFLPVILNGLSHLLGLAGFDAASGIVFKIRYVSLFAAPVLFLALCVVWSVSEVAAHALRQRFGGTTAPPSDTPSGRDSSPNEAAIVPSEGKREIGPGTFCLVPA